MKKSEDLLSVLQPTSEGMCCRLLIRIEEGELEIELSTEGSEALGMTLLAMVQTADEKAQQGMN